MALVTTNPMHERMRSESGILSLMMQRRGDKCVGKATSAQTHDYSSIGRCDAAKKNGDNVFFVTDGMANNPKRRSQIKEKPGSPLGTNDVGERNLEETKTSGLRTRFFAEFLVFGSFFQMILQPVQSLEFIFSIVGFR